MGSTAVLGCRDEFARYRHLEAAITELRAVPMQIDAGARERLLARLCDLRSRLVRYAVFATELGPVVVPCASCLLPVPVPVAEECESRAESRGSRGGSRTGAGASSKPQGPRLPVRDSHA